MKNNSGGPDGARLLTRTQIADMAGVTRAAVTTWERRAADFPTSRRTAGQDYFYESEVLAWLDGKRVPSHRRAPGEDEHTTYGDRARRRGLPAPTTQEDPTENSARSGFAPREEPDPRDVETVRTLMGPLAERVGGADEAVGYLSLLAALYFLRMTRPAGWRRVEEYPTSGEGLRSSGALLRLIGSEADAALYTSGSLPDMQEALSRLEPRRFEDVVEVVRLVARLGPHAFQLIVEGYEEKTRLGSREFFTPLPVAHLMAELGRNARATAASSVYDPYVRGGELLGAAIDTAAWARGGPNAVGSPPPGMLGQTPNRATLPLASMNLALRGARFALRLKTGGRPWEEAWPREPVDLVLTNPPFNMKDTVQETARSGDWPYGAPPVGNDNLAYAQYALSLLAEGGRAAVVMPNKAGNSGNAAELAIRRAFVEQGVVECVVALPDKLFSGTPVPVCVWLLRHPADAGDHVLFLDARGLGAVRRGGRRVLTYGDVRRVIHSYLANRTGGGSATPYGSSGAIVPGARVDRAALRDADYSLNPIHHVGGSPAPDTGTAGATEEDAWTGVSTLTERCRLLDERTAELRAGLETDRVRRARRRKVVLAELCDIQAGPSHALLAPRDRTPHGTVPVVSPKHLRDGEVSEGGDERVSAGLAERLKRYRLEADDIVCVRTGVMKPPALVRGHQTGWLMSSNVVRLRCHERAEALPGYLLAVLSRPDALDWVKDRAAATAAPFITKAVLQSQEVLLPPLDVQREVAELLAVLRERSSAHRELAGAVASAQRLLAEELTGVPSAIRPTV
ncbi:type I restriction-modification system subunit M/S [Streptomyces sudanensis]|uniref:type I restriction-modification system subunit M/S n=1 Tax=Streptomyces sudanensis TaxID=436397 RepID=UPI0020CE8CA4|nr:type I restriction-modification system subunit M/S [Streptomyces sudanensis]MCQ0001386.1 N-6 DNA methylase [Streptomyces sudanensis]